MSRQYIFKVFDASGTYLGVWTDVVSKPDWVQYTNSAGSVYEVELARIWDFGDDSTCAIGNRVDVYVYYGDNIELTTHSGANITTSAGPAITASTGATNGTPIFSGTITRVVADYDQGRCVASLSSAGLELSQFITYPPNESWEMWRTYTQWSPVNFGNALAGAQRELATVFTARENGILNNVKTFYMTATDPVGFSGQYIYLDLHQATDPTGINSGNLIATSSIYITNFNSYSESFLNPMTGQTLTGFNDPYYDGWDFDNVELTAGVDYVLRWRFQTPSTGLARYARLGIPVKSYMGYHPFRGWKYIVGTGWIPEVSTPYSGWAYIPYLDITPTGTTTYTHTDTISNLIKRLLDIASSQGGVITYNSTSIETLGTTITIETNTDTVLTSLESVMKAAPPDWYWYVDLATNVFYFKQLHTTADMEVILGGNLQSLNIVQSSEQMANVVQLTGGEVAEDTPLYMVGQDSASIEQWGRRLKVIQDSNIVDATTGQMVINNELERGNRPTYQTQLTLNDQDYDIDGLSVGMTIGFKNFDNHIDDLVLQVTGINYHADTVVLELATRFFRLSNKIHDLEVEISQLRNAKTSQVIT